MEYGHLGEEIASKYLSDKGYYVLKRNYRAKYSEIDLICSKEGTFVFVEVKCRSSSILGNPYDSVSKRKLRAVKRGVYKYIATNKLFHVQYRIDVVSIRVNSSGLLQQLKHFKNVVI